MGIIHGDSKLTSKTVYDACFQSYRLFCFGQEIVTLVNGKNFQLSKLKPKIFEFLIKKQASIRAFENEI